MFGHFLLLLWQHIRNALGSTATSGIIWSAKHWTTWEKRQFWCGATAAATDKPQHKRELAWICTMMAQWHGIVLNVGMHMSEQTYLNVRAFRCFAPHFHFAFVDWLLEQMTKVWRLQILQGFKLTTSVQLVCFYCSFCNNVVVFASFSSLVDDAVANSRDFF